MTNELPGGIPIVECPYLPDDTVLLADDTALHAFYAGVLGEDPAPLPEGNRRRIARSPGRMVVMRNIGTEKEKP